MTAPDKKPKWPAAHVEMRPTGKLSARPNNPRTHTAEQVEQIAAAMREWGWTNPVLIEPDGTLIAGHGRWMAAQSLGFPEVPCMVATGWTPAQVRAYVIADNKLALNAGWNEELLRAEIEFIEGENFDVALVGFGEAELDEMFADEPSAASEETEDDAPAIAKVAITRPGDVWILGQHRVMCGDSRNEESIRTLVKDAKIACCWTDPPYNVDYEGSAGKIQNDSKPAERFEQLLTKAFKNACTVMAKGAPIYIAHADTEGLAFRSAFAAAGFKLAGCLVWRKQSIVLGHSDYQWQHEPILYGWKPGAAHSWYGDRKESTIRDSGGGQLFEQRPDGSWVIYLNDTALVVKGSDITVAVEQSTIISEPKPARSSEHPTMKPVQLIERMLRNSTRPTDPVLDMFGGSGSTLIACHKLGRVGYILELDPHFVDVIVKRWQEYAGQPARRERDGAMFGTLEKAGERA